MANPILMGVDLGGYTLSATSTDPNYPLTNLQTYLPFDRWQSNSLSAQSLVIDFGSARACDYFVWHNHGWGNADAVILEAANDSGFSSGLVTVIAGGTIDPSIQPETDIQYYSFSSTTKRFWRLRCTIASPPLAGVPYVGNWYLGPRLDMGFPYDFGFRDGNPGYETVGATMLNGIIRKAQSFGARNTWKMDFAGNNGGISDAVRAEWRIFFNTVRGAFRPFYLLDTDGITLYFLYLDFDIDQSEVIRKNINDLRSINMKGALTT